MHKQLPIIIIILLFCEASFGQYKNLQQFIPKNFTILDSASGDLNKDGFRDLILILRSDFEKDSPDTTRPLLILEGNANGQYKLVARNDSVVLCKECGGIFGDPYNHITVKGSYFSIEHMGGSAWRWTRIITFKFDAKTNQFILHRDEGESWHTSNPNKTKESLIDKQNFDKLPFEKYTNNKE
ncbi:hypothetical protein ACI6Q2_18330 [Chitinophagaceae bacterium LWZ2-11]